MHVVVVCAVSLDGKLSTAARDPVRFTSRRDRARLHALRDAADAILLGARTIRAEDPPLLPAADRAEERARAGRRRWPVRAIFSATLDLPLGRALARQEGAPLYVFTTGEPDAGKRQRLEAAGALVRRASVREALQVLEREAGVQRAVC